MNKFTKVLSESNKKQYKVEVSMLSESVEISGNFVISEQTMSLAKEKAMEVISKNKNMSLVDIKQITETNEESK